LPYNPIDVLGGAGNMPRTHKRKNRDAAQAANYIAELSRELARIAGAHNCKTLSQLLEIAAIEADCLSGVPEGRLLS
jgi:hypothetical protein